jgi:5-deoxy-glucuronate isomerase
VSWHRPRATRITPEDAGWGYTGLRILEAGRHQGDTGEDEIVVVPLSGSASVESTAGNAELAGRRDVFAGPTDCAYVPRETNYLFEVSGRAAVVSARATNRRPFRHVTLDAVPVELRGAGQCSREVRNFATTDVLDADRLIACEVITPAGNWSSFPPHKHDTERRGETALEEIYYFEVAGGGMGYLRAAEVLAEVRSGDVVLIPYGYHGPAMAVPGYDLYYLNVMAGPGRREWLICDDPEHAWIRDQWREQPVDPRLLS